MEIKHFLRFLTVFQQFDFRTYDKQKEFDAATRYIRTFSAKCIAERKKLLSEGKDLPSDIMSMVVERAGNYQDANQKCFSLVSANFPASE